MPATSTETIVSAKDANDGDTVYLTSCDAWTRDISVGELLTSDDFDWRLAFAQRLREVVDATLTNALEDEHGLPELAA